LHIESEGVLIRLEDVSVSYRAPRERIRSFKEYAIRLLKGQVQYDEFQALRRVSLEIRQGEVFALIGHNGAGKSTLLKAVSRVIKPTGGRVWVKGRVAPLLELGAGFHYELSGRENVFLNGTLLGATRAEMESLFDGIVEFAGVGEFIDAPLRTYSTGMAARLAFAVATARRPDILLVDEVLSVGDEQFQQKCAERISEFRASGTSILLVTHDLGTVQRLCDRAGWLDHGELRAVGEPREIVTLYHQASKPAAPPESTPVHGIEVRSADTRLKVLSIFGTRPEAIKMAPVVRALRAREDEVASFVCVTAQHRRMLDQVLALFAIAPDFDLNLMQHDQSLTGLTAQALTKLDAVLGEARPDWVLVQGDTTTAMTGALAAFYRRIRVAHVEAGLRTGDRFHPFPEEINRRIADAVCDLHFAPTEAARANLLREGVDDARIVVTGNTVIDALLDVAAKPFDWNASELAPIQRDRRLILVTAHRRENFGRPLEGICKALRELAATSPDLHFVYPVHLNPHVIGPVRERLSGIENITLLDPLEYLPLVHLMKASFLILTDSGGLQEEAPGLGKPVLVLRDVTERPEGVEAGTVKLVGTECETIVRETRRLLDDIGEYERMARAVNPYGDGKASERIVARLLLESSGMRP
jgi:UDP-N-acetylglucosamine 2-epimerase (non-hydrolysing)